MAPITKACQKVFTPRRFIPFTTRARITLPMAVPAIPPYPPKSEVPPIFVQQRG